METSVLEEIGLSKGEIKVYLTLLLTGETKVGAVIEKASMASSAVYNSIRALINKGLVSYIKKGKVKFYQAVKPRQLVQFIEDKKDNLLKILPQLEEKQQQAEENQQAEVFQGKKGILSLLTILIENTEKGDEFLFFSSYTKEKQKDKEIQEFFKMYDAKRKEKELTVKGLAPIELKPLFKGRKIINMKYPRIPVPSDMSICKNKVAMISWGEKPIGYLITSKQISGMYREFFKRVWNSDKAKTYKQLKNSE